LVVGEEDVDELLRQQQQDHLVDSRVRKAQELGLQVVSDRWLLDSAAARTLLDDIPYIPLVSRVSCRWSCRVVPCADVLRAAGTRFRGSNACCYRD
jgi:hypothetical protein